MTVASAARIVLLAALGIAAMGCDRATAPESGDVPRAPILRLVEQDYSTPVSGIRRGVPVSIGDVFRPAFSGSRRGVARYACDEENQTETRRCSHESRDSEIGQILEVRLGRESPDAERTWLVVPPHGSVEFELPAANGAPRRSRFATAHATPALERRAIDAAPCVVPDRAELRFSIGIEEPAWRVGGVPVRFSVDAAAEGSSTRIFDAVLDPANDEGDRRWHDEVVDLTPWAGQRVAFTFRTENAAADRSGPSLPVWGDPTIFAPRESADERPWIVLMSLDTLRARSMSLYGREYETTPYLEELAAEGTTFNHAYTTFPKTHGSHMSAFSSLLPHRHGVFGAAHLGVRGDRQPPMLSERLRRAGWRTVAFTENGLLDGRIFSHGYERYAESKFLAEERGEARATFAKALDWLTPRADEGPFYVFVHTYEVHGPYDPDERYATFAADVPLELQRKYEQETRGLDDLLRDFVPRLRSLAGEHGLLLVIFADHGEEFFEHGGLDHLRLFDEVMHIPLVFHWPGHVAAGRVVDDVVSLTDVAPTVLDLAGLPAFERTDGTNLAPLLRPEGATLDREIVFGQVPPGGANHQRWQFIARSAQAKCFASVNEEDSYCFDLVADVGEKTRIAPGDTDGELAALWTAAASYRDVALPVVSKQQEARDAAPAAPGVDPARERKLRALGYIED